MKKIALKTYGKIITSIFSFLGIIFGISSCDEINNGKAMYGCPSADYKIKGTITSATDNTPVEGIQVTVHSEDVYNPDTAYTDESGEYKLSLEKTLLDSVKIVATDTHITSEMGKFKSDTIQIVFTNDDKTEDGDGNWDWGTYEKDNQDFSLEQETVQE